MDRQDLRPRVNRAGSHFFDDDTMRFFSSRLIDEWQLSDEFYLFVTSERNDSDPRAYTLRVATFYRDESGRERVEINAYGAFLEHATLAAARKAAREYMLTDGHRLSLAPSLMTSAERNAWTDALAGHQLWTESRGRRAVNGPHHHAARILERLATNGVLTRHGNGIFRAYMLATR